MLDKVTFSQNMAGLCEVYDRSLTKTLQNIYYAVLKDMQDDDFKQAIKRLLQERVFATFPKPAEILELSKIKKVAVVEVDVNREKAKEYIKLVHSMNEAVYQHHIKTGHRFDDCLRAAKFENVSDEVKAILNQVKPYYNHKDLVANISKYQTTKEAENAFIQAIEQSDRNEPLAINGDVRKMIKG